MIDGAAGNVYHDVSGRWTLERDSTSGSNLTRKNVLAITLIEPEMTISTSLDFDREEGKLVLWSFLGDPDSWEFMEYTKDPAEKSDKPPTEIK